MSSAETIREEAFAAPPVVVDVPVRLVTVEKRSGSPDVQKFDVATINASIDRAMTALKPEEKVVAIAYVDRYGANVAVVGRLPKVPGKAEWTIMGSRSWSGDWQASAAIRWVL